MGCKEENKKIDIQKPVGADSVKVFVLTKELIKKQQVFPSELIPYEKAELFAKANGYIKTIHVDLGDRVQNGQVLAVIEAPELNSNYEQANADLKLAQSKLNTSIDAFKRMENASKVSGTIASGELEKARGQMLADEASVEAAKSKLKTYAEYKNYLMIRAPFSGVVVQRNADPGSLVGSANAKPILVVENNSMLRLRVPIQEAFTNTVLDSTSIGFTVDAQPDKKFYAKLVRKGGTISKENRTETWEFMYDNQHQELKSGMYANATIKMHRPENSFVAAPAAIATSLEKKFVIRLSQGKAVWVDVRTGMNMGDKLEIFGNLAIGDTILMKANEEIKPGTNLLIKK
jgi:RND family efflux transporter MFP subunit